MKRILISALLLMCGCHHTDTSSEPQKNATVMLTAEGGVFMKILKEKGAIPGLPMIQSGNLQSEMLCDPTSEPTFPFDAHFRATSADQPDATFVFVVTMTNRNAQWSMTEARKQVNGMEESLSLPSAELQALANVELQKRKTDETLTESQR